MGTLFPILPIVAPGPIVERGVTADVGYEAAKKGVMRSGIGPIPRLDCLLMPSDACSSPHPRCAGPPREASGLGPRARANALGHSCSREANRRRLVYIRDNGGEGCSF